MDTNVLIVANGGAEQAQPDDVIACVHALEKARARGIVTIDSGNRIFGEYFVYMNHSGQPGVGDAFARWLHENQGNPRRCERVDITPKSNNGDEWDFEEFPGDPELAGFHRKDRKFVAVALASKYKPRVLNATDSDWWIFRFQLKRHGVKIQFLCPHLMPG